MQRNDISTNHNEYGHKYHIDTDYGQCGGTTDKDEMDSVRNGFMQQNVEGSQHVDSILVKRMTFNSIEEAEIFYNAHAKVVGFSIRRYTNKKNKDGITTYRKWVCSREGARELKYLQLSNRGREHRPITRVGCNASFWVRYDTNLSLYVVGDFNGEHNHNLVKAVDTQFLWSHRSVKIADKVQVQSMRNVGIKTGQVMDFMARQSGGYENVGFTEKDLYNHVDGERRAEVEDGDAQAALSYLRARSDFDQSFFYTYTVDSERRMENLFWADGRSISDYACFGDVIAFDTTYKTNAYKKPFVILIGVNNHHHTIVFGCALLANEMETTYVWVLESFLAAMANKRPRSVITDGDMAMRNAIEICFPDSNHRLCTWHLHTNAERHIKISGFASDFERCMSFSYTEQEFELVWQNMLEYYNLQDNSWVEEVYAKRKMWAESYLRGIFFAGMRSTQRSEGINGYLKRFLGIKLRLIEFVRQYDRALKRIRQKEVKADFETENGSPVLVSALWRIEKHAAEIYTRWAFQLFREELTNESLYYVVDTVVNGTTRTHTLKKYFQPTSTNTITSDTTSNLISCSCMRFETVGIPCRHIISVMKIQDMDKIPTSCIMKRWTKQAKVDIKDNPDVNITPDVARMMRYSALTSACNELSYHGSESTATFEIVRDEIQRMNYRVRKLCSSSHIHNEPVQCPRTPKRRNVGGVEGPKTPPKINVLDPVKAKTKGNPGGITKTVLRPRRCGNCHCIGHNRRKCPKRGSNTDSDDGRDKYDSTNGFEFRVPQTRFPSSNNNNRSGDNLMGADTGDPVA